jgi:hypothetical protein
MRHSHRNAFLVGLGLTCFAWTSVAAAQQQPAAAPATLPAPSGTPSNSSTTTLPDGTVVTTTTVTTPVVVQTAEPVGTTKTTAAFERDRAQALGPLPPASDSLELTLGLVYEQPFGKITTNQPLTNTVNAGGGVHLGVGYRFLPELTLGLYGTGSTFGRGDQVTDPDAHLYSASAGIYADWHFRPAGHVFDPWISLGSGWRGYWTNEASGNSAAQGWEIAKAQVGADFRVDSNVAIGPVIGADITTFFAESTPSSPTFGTISNPWANTFIFAGMMGRFDNATALANGSQVGSR